MILDKEQSIGIQEILRTVNEKKKMTYYINIKFSVFYNCLCKRMALFLVYAHWHV